MSWWVELLLVGFVFYESLLISIHKLLVKQNQQIAFWVLMGSKVVKLLLAVVTVVMVRYWTTLPLKRFALVLVAMYLVSTLFETIYFLKKKH